MSKLIDLCLDIILAVTFALLCFVSFSILTGCETTSQEPTIDLKPCYELFEHTIKLESSTGFELIVSQGYEGSNFILLEKRHDFDSELISYLVIKESLQLYPTSYFGQGNNSIRNSRWELLDYKCRLGDEVANFYRTQTYQKGRYVYFSNPQYKTKTNKGSDTNRGFSPRFWSRVSISKAE